MNYNDVVNRIKTIVEDHKMLVDFGYGQISDIKTRSEGGGELEGADYPYLFLNPTQHQRTQSTITYNFNMIVMDMAREEEDELYQNFLNIQSDSIQYIDDVIARLYYFYTDKPEVSFDLTYTPFYERFQDDLAGATATLSITVPNSINECIAPFEPDVPVALPIIYQISDTEVPGFFTEISSSSGGPSIGVDATIIDTNYLTEAGTDLDVNLLQDGTYRFKYTTTSQNLIDQSTIDAAVAANPTVWTDPYGKMYLQSGWFFGQNLRLWNELPLPFNTETIGTPYTLTHQFDISLPAGRYKFSFEGQPYVNEIDVVAQWSNVQYQIELVNLDPYEPVEDLVLSLASTVDQLIQPDGQQSPIAFTLNITDTYNGWGGNTYSLANAPNGLWTTTVSGTARRITDTLNFPTSPNFVTAAQGQYTDPDISNWPVNPPLNVDFDYSLTWTNIPLTLADGIFAWQSLNEPPAEDEYILLAGTTATGTLAI